VARSVMECACSAPTCGICTPQSRNMDINQRNYPGGTPHSAQGMRAQQSKDSEERAKSRQPPLRGSEKPLKEQGGSAQRRQAWRDRKGKAPVKQRRGNGSAQRRGARRHLESAMQLDKAHNPIEVPSQQGTESQDELRLLRAVSGWTKGWLDSTRASETASYAARQKREAHTLAEQVRKAQDFEDELYQALRRQRDEYALNLLQALRRHHTGDPRLGFVAARAIRYWEEHSYRGNKGSRKNKKMPPRVRTVNGYLHSLIREVNAEKELIARRSQSQAGQQRAWINTYQTGVHSPPDTAVEDLRRLNADLQKERASLQSWAAVKDHQERLHARTASGAIRLEGKLAQAKIEAAITGEEAFHKRSVGGLTVFGYTIPSDYYSSKSNRRGGGPRWRKYFGPRHVMEAEYLLHWMTMADLILAADEAMLRRECRGIVLGADGVVARPLHKFFEPHQIGHGGSEFGWEAAGTVAEATEKLDGSMVYVVPMAEGGLELWSKSGPTAISKAATRFAMEGGPDGRSDYMALISQFEEVGHTATFEWMGKQVQVRVPVTDPRLVLTQARSKTTGEYMPYEQRAALAAQCKVEVVTRYRELEGSCWYKRGQIDQVAPAAINKWLRSEKNREGLILRVADGGMLKVKTDWFRSQPAHRYHRWHSGVQMTKEANRSEKKRQYMEVRALRAVLHLASAASPSIVFDLIPQAAKVEAFYHRETGVRGAVVCRFKTEDERDQATTAAVAMGLDMHRAYSCRSNNSSRHRVMTWYPSGEKSRIPHSELLRAARAQHVNRADRVTKRRAATREKRRQGRRRKNAARQAEKTREKASDRKWAAHAKEEERREQEWEANYAAQRREAAWWP
jgi:hypothetical protein